MLLVVDDDELIVATLRHFLEHEGYEVKTAADGGEAFTHVRAPECRCMLLDVNMPKINGIELLILMQAEDIHVPTIVMAGFQDFDEEELKQFTNVVKFLPKPFGMDDMLKAIKTYAKPPARVH